MAIKPRKKKVFIEVKMGLILIKEKRIHFSLILVTIFLIICHCNLTSIDKIIKEELTIDSISDKWIQIIECSYYFIIPNFLHYRLLWYYLYIRIIIKLYFDKMQNLILIFYQNIIYPNRFVIWCMLHCISNRIKINILSSHFYLTYRILVY